MEAMISGRTGVALVMDGNQFASIHASDPAKTVPRHPGELHFLLGEGADFVTIENVTRDEVVRRLLAAQNAELALHFALTAMDRQMSEQTRRKAVRNLDDLVRDEDVGFALECVLYARPLSSANDIQGAMRLVREEGFGEAQTLLELLWTHQDDIRIVRDAWESIPLDLFQGEADHWQFTVVRAGAFRNLARQRNKVNEVFVSIGTHALIQALPNHRGVLHSWLGSFLQTNRVPETLFRVETESVVAEDVRPYGPAEQRSLVTGRDLAVDQTRDEEAIAAFQAGDDREACFRLLFDRYYTAVRIFFANRVHSAEDQIDLTQETFLRAYIGLENFRREVQFTTWLFRIAQSTYLKHLPRFKSDEIENAVMLPGESDETTEIVPLALVMDDTALEEAVLIKERQRLLREALAELPSQMRQVLVLRIYQQLSYREVAEVMELSVETVKTHLFQARKKLRERLKGAFDLEL